MDLRSIISSETAKLESISFVPTDKDPKAVLLVTADLTPEIATAIGCCYVFDTENNPQAGLSDVALDAIFRNTHLTLGTRDTMNPDLVHKWKVFRVDDTKLGVQCRIHLTGHFHELVDFLTTTNKDQFSLTLEPLQQELALVETP